MILPALTEATSPLFRPIKYSLFPPLGLAGPAEVIDSAAPWLVGQLAVHHSPNDVEITHRIP